MLLILLVFLLSVSFAIGWVRYWRHYYRLTGRRPLRIDLQALDGVPLTMWHRPAANRRYAEPVILCHGLGNNHRYFEFQAPRNLAEVLAEAGFDCFSVDCRGATPGAPRPCADATFDDYVNHDAPAFIDAALRSSGAARVLWVGHSFGGLIGLARAASEHEENIAGLVAMGSPTTLTLTPGARWLLSFSRLFRWLPRLRIDWLAQAAAPLAGRFRAPFVGGIVSLHNMEGLPLRLTLAQTIAPLWHGVLAQIGTWVDLNVFCSADGRINYRQTLESLSLPLLIVGGTIDSLATPQGCASLLAAVKSTDKSLLSLGKSSGQKEDYAHAEFMLGRYAHTEVHPLLLDWLKSHATPV
ncbi:MAG: alpha/beta hydrolase [Myxococcaceae bacterium]|nr:alpha/beta hydrolase [Myxococcaceae bacterium]